MRELVIKLGFPLGVLLFLLAYRFFKKLRRKKVVPIAGLEETPAEDKDEVWKKWNDASRG